MVLWDSPAHDLKHCFYLFSYICAALSCSDSVVTADSPDEYGNNVYF